MKYFFFCALGACSITTMTGDIDLKLFWNEIAMDEVQPAYSRQRKPEYMDLEEVPAPGSERKEVTQSNPQEELSSLGTDYAPLHPSTRSWEIPRNNVIIEKVIGKGAFGQVAKGTAIDLRGRPGNTPVAVKMPKGTSHLAFVAENAK